TGFGTSGEVKTSLPLSATGLVLDTSGRVVVAGSSGNAFGVARLNADGSPDTTFDGDGLATTSVLGVDVGIGVALQADGNIVVAGLADYDRFALLRFRAADGNLDTAFGGGAGY